MVRDPGDDGLPPAEASRVRRRERARTAQDRELMRTGQAKAFKQILDAQAKRAAELERAAKLERPEELARAAELEGAAERERADEDRTDERATDGDRTSGRRRIEPGAGHRAGHRSRPSR